MEKTLNDTLYCLHDKNRSMIIRILYTWLNLEDINLTIHYYDMKLYT